MFLKQLPVGPIDANCFIIGDEDAKIGAIIDPGDEPERIMAEVEKTGLDIKFMISTHGHFDHNGAAKVLKEKHGIEYIVHEEDMTFVTVIKEAGAKWGLEVDDAPEPDRFVEDGDVLEVGSLKLKVIHTPGHSPGGICIYIESEKVLFSGDTLFQRSIGRTDFRLGSMEDLSRSIREKLYVLPDEVVVYTGHGGSTTIGDEKTGNMLVRP